MSITSIHFVLFTILALGIYYRLPRLQQNAWLLLVSYIFTISWAWQFALVLGLVTTFNFLLALKLRNHNQGRRELLWLGITLNLIFLIFFRTVDYFLPALESLLARLGVPTQSGGLQVLIPLGLSFYILQAISYLVDVYRNQFPAEQNWVNFSLYLAYFPKIVAGPIERAQSFLPKLAEARVVNNSLLIRSIFLIFVGALRKLIIADTLTAAILNDVFEFPAHYTPPELIGWLIIYAFAIYNDFAGYTSIVRGVSGLFGIELSPNFRTPYFSRTFAEFWSRWHISLSEWLRNYIYFPLSRLLSRRNPGRRDWANLILPPMITMLLSGLWHGFGLHMLLWGFLHGIYQTVERVISLRRTTSQLPSQPAWRQTIAMGFVFILVLFAWIPFRWEMPATLDFWRALLNWSDVTIHFRRLFLVLPILGVSLIMDTLEYRNGDEFVYLRWPRFAQAVCMAVLLILIFIVTGGDFQEPFVYQAF